jgi:hypothetical protein
VIFRGLFRLLEFLLVLLVLRLVGRALVGLFSAGPPPRAQATPPPPARAVEDLVRDRVCNTFVPRSRALTASVAGREEHFCSAACRDRALAAVARAS